MPRKSKKKIFGGSSNINSPGPTFSPPPPPLNEKPLSGPTFPPPSPPHSSSQKKKSNKKSVSKKKSVPKNSKKKTIKRTCGRCGGPHPIFRCSKKSTSCIKLVNKLKEIKLEEYDFSLIRRNKLNFRNVTLRGVDSGSQGEICTSYVPNKNIDILFTTGLNGCLGVVLSIEDAISFVHIQSDLLDKIMTNKVKVNSKIEEKLNLMVGELSKKSKNNKDLSNLTDFFKIGNIYLVTVERTDRLYNKFVSYLNDTDTGKCKIFNSFSNNFGFNISNSEYLNSIFKFKNLVEISEIQSSNNINQLAFGQ